MADINERLGNKIKRYRKSVKMTQIEFAKRLGVTGSSVSAYENGTRQPSFDVLVKIASILGTTTDDLLGRAKNSRRVIDVSALTDVQIHTIEHLVVTFAEYNNMYEIIFEQRKDD